MCPLLSTHLILFARLMDQRPLVIVFNRLRDVSLGRGSEMTYLFEDGIANGPGPFIRGWFFVYRLSFNYMHINGSLYEK
jgi:hypothetical protein